MTFTRKLDNKQKDTIARTYYTSKYSMNQLAGFYKVSPSTISRVLKQRPQTDTELIR